CMDPGRELRLAVPMNQAAMHTPTIWQGSREVPSLVHAIYLLGREPLALLNDTEPPRTREAEARYTEKAVDKLPPIDWCHKPGVGYTVAKYKHKSNPRIFKGKRS